MAIEREFLRAELSKLMRFYHPRCIDPAGGYFQFFREDGSVHEPGTKHLVSSARMVINYAFAFLETGEPAYRDSIPHGVSFLRQGHRRACDGGYTWILKDGVAVDDTNHCYGLAFVLLAYAKALQTGLEAMRPHLDETWTLLERRFWEPQHGLYADEADADWVVSDYRGQNANLHLCEALIAAYEASGDPRYLERANRVADNMVNRQAAQCRDQVWEHYRSDWQIDWDYNKGDRSNIFRPWGLQPGHQVEWAKLLLQLDRHAPSPWRLRRARELFDVAVELAWDREHGGLIYGYDPQGRPYDRDKYSWVQIEALATAVRLHRLTGEQVFADWIESIARHAYATFVDPRTGCWYRIRTPENAVVPEPAPFSGLTDYHTISAYCDVLAGYSAAVCASNRLVERANANTSSNVH